MRKISATYIFPGNRPPLKNGILVCADNGKIIELIDTGGQLKEEAGLEHYSGILVPGFINAHCHLELSHLKGKIPEKTGMGGFLTAINQLRNEEPEVAEEAAEKANRQLVANGTVAVGDVSNSTLTLEKKRHSKIYYHTFAEAFGFHPSRAERAFSMANFVKEMCNEFGLGASVVPHSSYSVSAELFRVISENARAENSLLSVHNQESRTEEQFFSDGSGPIACHLKDNLGIDISHWKPTGKSSLLTTLEFLPPENQLFLVHNTFTEERDILDLKQQRKTENTFFVLCPNSNLFIENALPSVPLFQKHRLNICLGTDSLASNQKLSILAEMITLQQHFPEITLEELVLWGTFNGAKALQVENRFGSFEPGKQPGVNLITGADLKKLKLTEQCQVKLIVRK
ncbi:Cytosine/adenosine deaminase [Tangfeifania diversioriginum]|uniref:Cytosine/adenosine deaminase n=1 Tax=Tangfeifania diversioriginum TaxID=1168035 RepID=A0A1M6P174_9BACT|nr:amidohydrolase family protein [Tangfeifania diversioriginum]SHK01715.1 Cytosine/adenosine deaminase [Tangfeifania diversioriginum]